MADLQSTTGHVNQYQTQPKYQQEPGYLARSETPPPLPPPPPQEVLDSIPPPRQFEEVSLYTHGIILLSPLTNLSKLNIPCTTVFVQYRQVYRIDRLN